MRANATAKVPSPGWRGAPQEDGIRGPERAAPPRRATRHALAAAALALAAACAHAPREAAPPREEPAPRERAEEGGPQVGFASFYGRRFQGRRTASGERYDMHALTCAHPTAPFGARLRVTDLETGRSVVVVVNDRGPYAKGRVVDLSLAAAKQLGIVRRGVVRVRVERLDERPAEREPEARAGRP